MTDEHDKEVIEIKEALQSMAKSVRVINREMGETRDEITELKLAMINSNAKLKEELLCKITDKMDESKRDRALLHEELGKIKERLKIADNGRQWFEKTLIFLLGATLTIIGFLLRLI